MGNFFYLSNDYLGAFWEVAGFCCQWRDTHYPAWDLIVLEPNSFPGSHWVARRPKRLGLGTERSA